MNEQQLRDLITLLTTCQSDLAATNLVALRTDLEELEEAYEDLGVEQSAQRYEDHGFALDGGTLNNADLSADLARDLGRANGQLRRAERAARAQRRQAAADPQQAQQPTVQANQPAPAGNQPGNNGKLWKWVLALAIAALLIGGTAWALSKAGWGPQTQTAPAPAADPQAADQNAPAAPAAGNASGLTNPVLTIGNKSPLVMTKRTEFVQSTDPQASQPGKVVMDSLFTDQGEQITVKGALWCDADGNIELSYDNGTTWSRAAEFSERIKLQEGTYRLRIGDDGGRSAVSFQEAP